MRPPPNKPISDLKFLLYLIAFVGLFFLLLYIIRGGVWMLNTF